MAKFEGIAAHFIVGVKDFAFNSELDSFLKAYPVSGLALFNSPFDKADNIWKDRDSSLEKVHDFVSRVRKRVNFLAVDQEGGRVRRLRGAFLNLPAPQTLSEKIEDGFRVDSLLKLYELAAEQMALSHLRLNFAPVCDLLYNESSNVIGDRSFSKKPEVVLQRAKDFCRIFESKGVHTTLKHYPGHGPSQYDSHEKIAVLFKPKADLAKVDTKIFKDLQNDASAILTAHIAFEDDPERIFSLDAKLIQEARASLRSDLAWITDDLQNMKAVSELKPWKKAYQAGYDFLLLCGDLHGAASAIEETIKLAENSSNGFQKEQEVIAKISRAKKFFVHSEASLLPFAEWKAQILERESKGLDILGEMGLASIS